MGRYIYEIIDRRLIFQVFIKEKIHKFSDTSLELIEQNNLDWWDFLGSNSIISTKKIEYPNVIKFVGWFEQSGHNYIIKKVT